MDKIPPSSQISNTPSRPNTPVGKIELGSIQACRAIAAISVLLFHVNITLRKEKYLSIDIFPIFNQASIGVEFFFVLSGFIILYAHSKDIGHPSRINNYIYRRFTRLFPALWITLVIITLAQVALPSLRPPETFNPIVLISDFFLLPSENNDRLAISWTLRHEILFYIMFLSALISWKLGTFVLLATAIPSILAIFFEFMFPFNKVFTSYNILFIMGIGSYYITKNKKYSNSVLLFIGLALLIIGILYAYRNNMYKDNISGVNVKSNILIIFYGIGSMLIITGLCSIEISRPIKIPSFLIIIGNASYAIYLVHYPIISFMSKISTEVYQRCDISPKLIFVVVAAVAISGGLLFHLIVEKPVIDLFRRRRSRSLAADASIEVQPRH